MPLRVLTWNLFHGRAIPSAGRDLQDEFGAALRVWAWDVALLQEVPPWWPEAFVRDGIADEHDTVRTSRNLGLPLRRALARRWPDVLKSNGGGANAILVREGAGRIGARERVVLRHRPERRVAHGVRCGGRWWVNLHAQVHSEQRAQADLATAIAAARTWAGPGAPLVVGGDLNVRTPVLPEGLHHLGGHKVDHVLGTGAASGESTPDRGVLSDHIPVLVTLSA